MEADLRILNDLKNQIERGRSNFKKSPKDLITETHIMARLEGLEDIIKRFINKHESIVSSYDSDDLEESGYFKNDVFNMGYESYLVYKAELKLLLSSQSRFTSNLDASSSNAIRDVNVRLPKICIPVFSGNYAEWSSFKDLFISLVHNNSALDDVQRLHYLKTQLMGEAEQLIKHIPITQANYTKCWDLLQNRFNNKRFMLNCILKRLFSQRVMTSESSNGLKDLLDTTSDCMHELSNLGINVDTWDIVIIYIVSLKLDVETRKQWELHVNSLREELPTFTQLKEFLESRFRALEFVEPSKLKNKIIPITYNNSNAISNVTCPYCAENHKLFSCNKFIKEDVKRRQDIVKSLSLCFNCLGINHTEKNCRVLNTCRICKKRHHSLLHGQASLYTVAVATEATETGQDDEEDVTLMNEPNNIASHFATGLMPSQTLLPTALIKVESLNGHPLVLRALLDQGSQASFISESTVSLLGLNKISEKSCISGLGGGLSNVNTKHVVMVNMQSAHDPSFKLQIKAHVLNKVTSVLPVRKFNLPHWVELSQIVLADPQYNAPNEIDILLGAEVYCSILKQGLIKHPKGSIIAQDTHLGWVLSGQIGGCEKVNREGHNIILNTHVISQPNCIEGNMINAEEQICAEHLNVSNSRGQSVRYAVELPFCPNVNSNRSLGHTKSLAVKRFKILANKLLKKTEHKKAIRGVKPGTESVKEENKVWFKSRCKQHEKIQPKPALYLISQIVVPIVCYSVIV